MDGGTGVNELDLRILKYLDRDTLQNMSKTSKRFANLAQSDYLWKKKVLERFTPEIAQMKPYNISFHQQYMELTQAFNAKEAIQAGRADLLLRATQNGNRLSTMHANKAAKYGQLELLKWLATRSIYPTHKGADSAVEKGHLKVLIWLSQEGILPSEHSFFDAIRYGHLSVLKWLAHKGYQPTQEWFEIAIFYDQIEIFGWLLQQQIRPRREIVQWIILQGKVSLLKMLARHTDFRQILNNIDLQTVPNNVYAWLENHQYLNQSCTIL